MTLPLPNISFLGPYLHVPEASYEFVFFLMLFVFQLWRQRLLQWETVVSHMIFTMATVFQCIKLSTWGTAKACYHGNW